MTDIQDRQVARINARAEQKRLDRAAELQLERERHALEEERRETKDRHRATKQAEQAQASADRKTARRKARVERKTARGKARAASLAKVRDAAPQVGKTLLIAVPILAPMSVAWIGQIGFAINTLGWVLAGALIFAAAWELTTAFTGWMYHQARQEGDGGTLYRLATWVFAASAGAMNYWHACPVRVEPDGREVVLLDPTPKAVSFGVMSLVGIAVWELYATLIHRKKLRADRKLPPARPKFGIARWARYPRITWTAWSLTIRYQIPTSEQAWAMAVAKLDQGTPREKPAVRVTLGQMTVIRTGEKVRHQTPPQPTLLTTPWGGFSVAGRGLTPMASTLVQGPNQGGSGTWFDARELHLEPVVFAAPETTLGSTPQRVVRATPESTSETTPETSSEPTAESMDSPAQESTSEPTRETTKRSAAKGGSKARRKGRRSRDELRVELEKKVAAHYEQPNPGELEVAPLARELGSTRKTIRELLDEMNVRPIRKVANQ